MLETTTETADEARAMSLLRLHVPLCLLCDLVDPLGPSSRDILAIERVPVRRWWGVS